MRESDFWKKLAKGLRSDPSEIKKLWIGTFESNLRPRKSMVKLALGLKRRGYKIAILSNAIKIHSDHVSRKNIYQLFSPVVLSFEVGMNKPSRNIYNLTARRMGLKANECLFIDDKEENVKVARSVGMHGIVFRNVTQLKTELKKVL
jgi:putative hydrolase of the HAD superfamily